MSRRNYSSTAQRTTLSAGCTDVATTMTVTAVTGWPGTTPYTIIVDPDTVNEEIMSVTARAGLNLTVTRAVGGSVGVAHSSGAVVQHGVYAADFDEANLHVNSSTSVHGVTGEVVGTTDTQTLAGKTLTTPTIASMVNANHDHSAGAGGGLVPQSSVTNLVSALAAKYDTAPVVNAQTGTTYTFATTDLGKTVTLSNASPVTLTLSTALSGLATGAILRVVNLGAGLVTVTPSGTTIAGTPLTLATNKGASIIKTGTNAYVMLPFSGADAATYSATTGSPTITTVSGKTLIKWTGDGSVTLTKGFVRATLVGAGGGGGSGTGVGGGGGAGGLFASDWLYIPADGTYTVKVGSAGAAGVGGNGGTGGYSGLVGLAIATGGGGGGCGAATFSGQNGASGGGAGWASGQSLSAGVSNGQGFTGVGTVSGDSQSSGGGGSSGAGAKPTAGAGTANDITGGSVTYAAGGAGASGAGTPTAGGANTGTGGGGGWLVSGAAGGSGVVFLLIG